MNQNAFIQGSLQPLGTLSLLMAFIGLAPLVGGCGGGGGAPAPAAPAGGTSSAATFSITNAAIAPTRFSRFVAGQASVRAEVTAGAGVANVVARIQRTSDGRQLDDFALALQTGSTYQATVAIPSNLRIDGQSEIYTVTLVVTDALGAQRIDAIGTIEVPSPLGDPGTPGGVPPPPALSRKR